MHVFPFLYSSGKISLIFEKLMSYKIITKFTYRQLLDLVFSVSKDRPVLPFLISLVFLDQAGSPTQNYFYIKDLRILKRYLNERISLIYKPILANKEYVSNVSIDVLAGIFMEVSGEIPGTCLVYAKTLKSLIEFSGFVYDIGLGSDTGKKMDKNIAPNINISINLPSTTDDAVYDKLFRHLKDFLSPQ